MRTLHITSRTYMIDLIFYYVLRYSGIQNLANNYYIVFSILNKRLYLNNLQLIRINIILFYLVYPIYK